MQLGFDLRANETIVTIDDRGEALFQLPKRYGVQATFLAQLQSKFYESSEIQASSVPQFRNELLSLRDSLVADLEPQIAAEHRVRVRAPELRRPLIERLMRRDHLYDLLQRLVALCDHCSSNGLSIQCEGD